MYQSRYALGDVPTVDVPSGLNLAIPGVAVTPNAPNVFLVPRPVAAPLGGTGVGLSFTPLTLALLAGGAAAVLMLSRRRGR